jgi:hypothetical protein
MILWRLSKSAIFKTINKVKAGESTYDKRHLNPKKLSEPWTSLPPWPPMSRLTVILRAETLPLPMGILWNHA